MKKYLILLFALLLPATLAASGLQSSFTGSNLTGLTRDTTRFESWGDVDSSGNLIDHSGRGHDLTPNNSPTSIISPFQGASGRNLSARAFASGSSQSYSVAHHADFNVFDTDHTITLVSKATVDRANAYFSHYGNGGIRIYRNAASDTFKIGYYNSSGVESATFNGGDDAINKYHILQIVRQNDYVTVYNEGVISESGLISSTIGYDVSAILHLANDIAGTYSSSNLLYFRLDAEALSLDRLNYERNQIMGIGPRSGTAPIGYTFSRSTTAYQTNSDGTLSLLPVNFPRNGGDGGGVLIEEQRQNVALQSQTFQTTWGTSNASVSPDIATVTAPDGTATSDGFIANASDVVHYLTQAIANSNVNYTFSIYGRSGNKTAMFLNNNGVAAGNSSFDLANCSYLGGGGDVVSASAVQAANGWCRVSATWTLPAASNTVYFGPINSLADWDFAGDGATVNIYLWGAQLEIGSHPTSYVTTTTTAVTRTADSLTIRPYKIGKGLLLGGEKLWVDFTQAVGATLTTNGGSYVFTTGGTPVRQNEWANGEYYYYFNGTDAQYVLADASAAWAPAGDFSVVLIATPLALPAGGSYMYAIGKYTTTGDKRSWAVYYNSSGDWTLAVSKDGDSGTTSFVQKAGTATVGRPQLIVATFECSDSPSCTPGNNHTGKFYVDDLPVNTDPAFYGPACATLPGPPPTVNDANMNIGRSGGGSRFNGYLHYAAFYDGKVISPTEVETLYSKFKQANILPPKMGDSYLAKKLYIEFDGKCEFSSMTDMGTTNEYRPFLEISANYGSADSNTNRIRIMPNFANGKFQAIVNADGESTSRYMITAAAQTDYNIWQKYKILFDLSELSNSWAYKGSTALTLDATMTGAKNLDLTDTRIRIGSDYIGTTQSDCTIKNLRILPGAP